MNPIGSTRTTTGLRVRCEFDTGKYPQGRVISDKALATVSLQRHDFHGDWNYTIFPRDHA